MPPYIIHDDGQKQYNNIIVVNNTAKYMRKVYVHLTECVRVYFRWNSHYEFSGAPAAGEQDKINNVFFFFF